MRKPMMAAGAFALAIGLSAPAMAGEVLFSGSGVFGPTISTLAPVEVPGDTFAFSFDLPGQIAANPTTQVTNSNFVLEGSTIADAISYVYFYPASDGGGFDLGFAGGPVLDLYLTFPNTSTFADAGSDLTIATGHYNFTLDDPSGYAGSGSVSLTAVPEPAAWSLMVLGFGGLGAALRRRVAAVLA